jgi:hypothetical protein
MITQYCLLIFLQKKLQSLLSLELYSCPFTETDDYRNKLWEALDNVKFIDGIDSSGNPAPNDDDDEEGDEGL